MAPKKTKNLISMLDSDSAPTGKIIILAIKAAKIAYAIQLNHLKILDLISIFSELTTPKNLDK